MTTIDCTILTVWFISSIVVWRSSNLSDQVAQLVAEERKHINKLAKQMEPAWFRWYGFLILLTVPVCAWIIWQYYEWWTLVILFGCLVAFSTLESRLPIPSKMSLFRMYHNVAAKKLAGLTYQSLADDAIEILEANLALRIAAIRMDDRKNAPRSKYDVHLPTKPKDPSYGITAICVDFNKIRLICESKNKDLCDACNAKVLEKMPLFKNWHLRPDPNEILDDIINGETRFGGWGTMYYYVFTYMCEAQGHILESRAWYPNSKGDDLIRGSQFLNVFPVELPRSFEIHPAIACIERNNFTFFEDEFSKMDLEKDELEELQGWINKAKASGLDLVLAYY